MDLLDLPQLGGSGGIWWRSGGSVGSGGSEGWKRNREAGRSGGFQRSVRFCLS